jgi:hypothetical protein
LQAKEQKNTEQKEQLNEFTRQQTELREKEIKKISNLTSELRKSNSSQYLGSLNIISDLGGKLGE